MSPVQRMSPVQHTSRSVRTHQIAMRLKFYFACLTCLGGLLLSAGTGNSTIPLIAVFFSIFGFVCVDWLELFALPPIAAYAAMAVAAFVCVSSFLELDAPANHQLVTVAQLLVFVQAILMLQGKTRRILEQLGVFCLLQLIVAAVFNDAISYGLLLIPIAVVGALALGLLAVVAATERMGEFQGLGAHGKSVAPPAVISFSAPESWESMTSSALRLPQAALITLAPAVILVGAIFFYALPRTTDAARIPNRGNALVGFSDELRLEQIGQMMQSNQAVLRLYLTEQPTGEPYYLVGGVYLRGKVLERYRAQLSGGVNTAVWSSAPAGAVSEPQSLPAEYLPEQEAFDRVDVMVVCEATRSDALFSVAPYYVTRAHSEIVHVPERWTLARSEAEDWVYPRIEYQFGTHAFRSGIQADVIAYRSLGEVIKPAWSFGFSTASDELLHQQAEQQRRLGYEEELLEFDVDAMPTVAELASQFVTNAVGERRGSYQIAKAMERHFATLGRYEYTLNLNAESIPGVDPIEQFLRVDRRGHCQYFASALAMMLRSEGIPSRIVVGYHSDEYNELGGHFVARQLHAHAWVEALIERDQFDAKQLAASQPPSERYWLRLDPTPAAGRMREASGGVVQVLDLAQNIWDDYVVDMNADRQENVLLGGGSSPMNRSYQQFVDRLAEAIASIRAGELGGGALASGNLFSWPAAVIGGLVALTVVLLLRFRQPAWLRRRIRRDEFNRAAQPSVAFYAEALRQLERIDVVRRFHQTPDELAAAAESRVDEGQRTLIAEPVGLLTRAFYQARFGSCEEVSDLVKPPRIEHASRRSAAASPDLVDHALAELTRGIDSVLIQMSRSE